MPDIVWYRSLYWRIALGFVALLAVLLAVQAAAFLWLSGRAAEILPGRSPAEYAQTIAADLAGSLVEHPELDIDKHLNDRYRTTYRPFVVIMRDGRTVTSRSIQPPFDLSRMTYGRLMGRGGPPRDGRGGPPPSSDRTGEPGRQPPPDRPNDRPADRSNERPPDRQSEPGRPPFDRRDGFGRGGGRGPGGPGGPSQPSAVFAPVVINSETAGMVGVTSDPRPLSGVFRDLGPTLGIVAVALLLAGTSIGALLIFRPTHRRLRSLQDAARAIGEGQAGVRATASGGDEVANLALAFNEMAGGLEQRTQALVAADESRRQLLADVSHELMTPLAAIRGYVETMAMSDLKLNEDTRQRYLQIVSDETERMEHIIGELLDLARLEGGGGDWKREPVVVASLFERVQHRHDPVLGRRNIKLLHSVAPEVVTVTGDSKRLEQAIQNLAANAVRHTPEGGTIRLTASQVPAGIEITVEDSGPGIPPEHLPRIFDRFYKVDFSRTGTALPSGSGLGLSIVQAIVRRHGGTIEANNAPTGGARFRMVLPA